MRATWMILCLLALPPGARAQEALPNENLPGNSATLPNSNTIGSLPTSQPIYLQSTDSSPAAEDAALQQAQRFQVLERQLADARAQVTAARDEAAQARSEAAALRAEAAALRRVEADERAQLDEVQKQCRAAPATPATTTTR